MVHADIHYWIFWIGICEGLILAQFLWSRLRMAVFPLVIVWGIAADSELYVATTLMNAIIWKMGFSISDGNSVCCNYLSILLLTIMTILFGLLVARVIPITPKDQPK